MQTRILSAGITLMAATATAELSTNMAGLSLNTLGLDRSEEIREAFDQLHPE